MLPPDVNRASLPPERISSLWNDSIALHRQGRYAAALACLETLSAYLPEDPALLSNLGVVSRDAGDLARAERCFRELCAREPRDAAAHYNLALTLLRAGNLREGFEHYEWRWRLNEFAPQRREFSQPLWDGAPLGGRRILLYSEQGAGDALQFVRYAPLVAAAGGQVVLEALPHLERLMGWLDGGYPVVNALTPGVQFDVQCPLMSLPHRCNTTLDSLPPPAAFRIPPAMREKWKARFPAGVCHVGLAWAGNPLNPNDAFRSIPPELFAPLAKLPGVRCVSLQVGSGAGALSGVAPLADQLTDFADTAATISCLDLVITVDTAVAHLAGSLAKPAWLLAAYASDWRWLLDREDTPWYPSLRLFRQKTPGDWAEVLNRVAARLRQLSQAVVAR